MKHTIGARVSDRVTAALGSWSFVIAQTFVFALWMFYNSQVPAGRRWDAYPFILLNLVLSFSSAYANSIILMSQNRAAERDRGLAQKTFTLGEQLEAKETAALELLGAIREHVAQVAGDQGVMAQQLTELYFRILPPEEVQ